MDTFLILQSTGRWVTSKRHRILTEKKCHMCFLNLNSNYTNIVSLIITSDFNHLLQTDDMLMVARSIRKMLYNIFADSAFLLVLVYVLVISNMHFIFVYIYSSSVMCIKRIFTRRRIRSQNCTLCALLMVLCFIVTYISIF